MLSAQCEELRAMAESVGLAMPQAATLMMEAADTIWSLRCKLSDMVDERERTRVAEVENVKLRELAKEAHLCMVNEGSCEDCYATHGECPIERDMRELGVEVEV